MTQPPRKWPYPSTDGTTIHLITDMHFGAHNGDPFVQHWHGRHLQDLESMRVEPAGHVNTGDMVDDTAGWDDNYVSWRTKVNRDGKPYIEAVGNHDLDYVSGVRSAAQWAQAVGVTSQNRWVDIGDVRVIAVGPERWDSAPGAVAPLPQSTLDYLAEQLSATTRPCLIAAHCPLAEQFPADVGSSVIAGPSAALTEIIDSHPNAVGWLSGHKHINPQAKTEHARVMTVGSRRIFAVNGPPAGGGRLSFVDYQNHQWQSINQTMYLTYLGDALDVRWRDHLGARWVVLPQGERVRRLALT